MVTPISYERLGEECGVFAAILPNNPGLAAILGYMGLFTLQHRGHQSSGLSVVNEYKKISTMKGLGEATTVFENGLRLSELPPSNLVIGHDRYTTHDIGEYPPELAVQPIVRESRNYPFALSHNGHIVNTHELERKEGITRGVGDNKYVSDSDLISLLIKRAMDSGHDFESATIETLSRLEGAFSIAVMGLDRIIAARDPHGFRPLVLGRIAQGGQIITSEYPAVDIGNQVKGLDVSREREISPGEVIILDGEDSITKHPFEVKPQRTCLFEYVYFARPDGSIEGRNIQFAREEMGRQLAEEHPVEADMVIGVPESGIPAALGYSEESGIPYKIGVVRNSTSGRTFIGGDKSNIESMVGLKLNPIAERIRGERVIVVDDSIVRGNTTKKLVKMLRDAGATEVHLRISSPPYKNPCYYGMATGSHDELIAADMTDDKICEYLGADSLGYLSLSHLQKAIGPEAANKTCDACMTGNYPTDIPVEITR